MRLISLLLICLLALQLATATGKYTTQRVRSRLARSRAAAFVETNESPVAKKTRKAALSEAVSDDDDESSSDENDFELNKAMAQPLSAKERLDAQKSKKAYLVAHPEYAHLNVGASFAEAQLPINLTKDALDDMSNTGEGSDPFDSPAGGKRHKASHNLNLSTTDLSITKPVRKNILHMAKARQQSFLDACNLLKEEPHLPPYGHNVSADDNSTSWTTWDWLSYKHFAISLIHPAIANGALFLPWHRQWLMLYEDNMRRVLSDDSFALPYWDWSNRYESMKIFTDVLIGGNGTGNNNAVSNGAFGHWDQKVDIQAHLVLGPINRRFGVSHQAKKISSFGTNISYWTSGTDGADDLTPEQKQAGTFPSACDVLKTLGTRKYWTGNDQCKPSVAFGLWYLHRLVHVQIGGDMNLVPSNDPVLLLHHAFLDKLWMMWQKAHRTDTTNNRYGFPEGAMTDNLRWVGGTAGEMIKWEEMPYHYQWDDTIDNMFYKYYKMGKMYSTMCWTWNRQINGADGGRNMTSLCHVYE